MRSSPTSRRSPHRRREPCPRPRRALSPRPAPGVRGRSGHRRAPSLAVASCQAGLAFTKASVGYVHAIAHQIGALYHLPHGHVNAVFSLRARLLPGRADSHSGACASLRARGRGRTHARSGVHRRDPPAECANGYPRDTRAVSLAQTSRSWCAGRSPRRTVPIRSRSTCRMPTATTSCGARLAEPWSRRPKSRTRAAEQAREEGD